MGWLEPGRVLAAGTTGTGQGRPPALSGGGRAGDRSDGEQSQSCEGRRKRGGEHLASCCPGIPDAVLGLEVRVGDAARLVGVVDVNCHAESEQQQARSGALGR